MHDERWQEESTTIMTTPLNLRIGYDYDQGDNTGGGKIYFGDNGCSYIGESDGDSDDLILSGENGVSILTDSGNVYINGQEVQSAAFKSAGVANGVATLDAAGKVPQS